MTVWNAISRPVGNIWDSIPQRPRYVLFGLASLASSIIGVLIAAHNHCPSSGGRGGAIATIVAIFIVLLRPDYGLRMLNSRLDDLSLSLPDTEQLKEKVSYLIQAMRINSQGSTRLNIGLVIASMIGTIFWGFGDLIAQKMIDWHWF
jgi:hypothetical protein